jgi:DnaK suppressor protein
MSNKETSLYRQMLLNQKEAALAGLGAKAHVLSKTDRICEEDQAQYSLEEAVSLRLNGLEYTQLRRIQEALDRLQLGEFGICLACDQPIPTKRLNAIPSARYCVPCQETIAEDCRETYPRFDED